jgi:hypothetical protein
MGVIAANVLMGPGSIYQAPYGTVFPADSAATVAAGAPAGFADTGGTHGGITMMVDQTIQDMDVDQVPDPIGGRLTARKVQLQVELAEVTLPNLGLVLNGLLTIGVQASYTTADLQTTVAGFQPTYVSLIFDGFAPTLGTGFAARRRMSAYKTLSTAKIQEKHDKKTQRTFAATFTCYYVSGSQSPVHWVDQTA